MILAIFLAAQIGIASFFDSQSACCIMASGKDIRRMDKAGVQYAASWHYPLGSLLKVTNIKTGTWVEVVVWDRGPNRRLDRIIDLSRQAFKKIANTEHGLVKVKVELRRLA